MGQTFRKSMEGFTKHNLQTSYLAHKVQLLLSHSLDKTFTEMVSRISVVSDIPSCPHDIANANHIYGTDLDGGEGKDHTKLI